MTPCTVWLLIYVHRSLTFRAVQRTTLQEAARSGGRPACKQPPENDFVPFWLCRPVLRLLFFFFFGKSLGSCIVRIFFFFSLRVRALFRAESPWSQLGPVSFTGLKHWGNYALHWIHLLWKQADPILPSQNASDSGQIFSQMITSWTNLHIISGMGSKQWYFSE